MGILGEIYVYKLDKHWSNPKVTTHLENQGDLKDQKIMWFVYKKVVLTKDNLAKRNCEDSK